MFLIPTEEMPSKLKKSWTFLSGESIDFKQVNQLHHTDNKHFIGVILPVYYDQETSCRSLAIGLLIDEAEAQKVASHMFGLAKEALTLDDIKDACKESCNVLGGGLVSHVKNRLGIPEEIPTDEFITMENDSKFHVSFTSDGPFDELITLIIMDVSTEEARSE